jgi:hypothetical protein
MWSRLGRAAPSPSMVLSLVALFAAMSGTTWAVVKVPKRSVGTVELKKGAVRSENIAQGTVTSKKLSSDLFAAPPSAKTPAAPPSIVTQTLPSDGIAYVDNAGYADYAGHADTAAFADHTPRADQATSATSVTTAPTAATATTANTAASAADADKLDGKDSTAFVPKSVLVEVPRFTLGDDQTRMMMTSGPFTLTARCYTGHLGGDSADVLITTTEPHSAYQGFSIDTDLNPGGVEKSVIGVDGPTGTPVFESSAKGTAIAPSGAEIRSIVFYVGLNVFGQAGRCTFGGFALV